MGNIITKEQQDRNWRMQPDSVKKQVVRTCCPCCGCNTTEFSRGYAAAFFFLFGKHNFGSDYDRVAKSIKGDDRFMDDENIVVNGRVYTLKQEEKPTTDTRFNVPFDKEAPLYEDEMWSPRLGRRLRKIETVDPDETYYI